MNILSESIPSSGSEQRQSMRLLVQIEAICFPGYGPKIANPDLVIQLEKMTVDLYVSWNCMKIGHGSDLGIKGLRNLGIE